MNYRRNPVSIPRPVLVLVCVALLWVFGSQAFGQAGIDTGSITGTVKDPTGALVVGATCTLTNTATGVTQKAITTSAGSYSFPIVQAGIYTLRVSAKGFQESIVDGIIVHLGTTDTEDVPMKVGATTASVAVTSAAPLLQAQDASLGMTIDNKAATELPIYGGSGGRNFMSLAQIAPGVQPKGNNSNTGAFLIHSVQSGAVDVRVNGADDNNEVWGGVLIAPIPDTIEEFKLETGDNPAELGRSYGTVVNVVTKTGTNQFRGTAWEYNENDMYNANDYFNKRSQLSGGKVNRPGKFKENSFGAIYGGPVIIPHVYDGHNKTFFTADFQYTYYTDAPSFTGTLPTGTMQSSNFTNLVDILGLNKNTKIDGLGRTFQQGTILDPATTRWVPCGSVDPITGLTAGCAAGQQGIVTDPALNSGNKVAIIRDPYFQELGPPAGCPSLAGTTNWVPGSAGGPAAACFNQLPAGRLDPNALKLLQLYKAYSPNQPGFNSNGVNSAGTYVNNFFTLMPRPITTKQYDVRIDHAFSDKDSSYLTFSHYNSISKQQPPFAGDLEGGNSAPFWGASPSYMVVITETHVFNPRLINQFRGSDTHGWSTSLDPATGNPSLYGILGVPTSNGLSEISPGSNISDIGGHQNPTWRKSGAWTFSDNVTWTRGKHEWKFGGEYWSIYGNIAQPQYPKGHFSYGQYSNVPASGDGGPAVADFLINPIYNAAQGAYALPGSNALSTGTVVGTNATGHILGGLNGYQGNNWEMEYFQAPYLAFYASDSWKITPALTAYMAMRYEYYGAYDAQNGKQSNFWMGGAGDEPGGTALHIAHDGCSVSTSNYFKGLLAYDNIPIICEPGNTVNKNPKANWAPRFGLAYRVTPRIVTRAGAGITYGAFNSYGANGTLGTNYPFALQVQNGINNSYTPNLIGASGTTATMENTFGIVDLSNPVNAYQPAGSIKLFGKPYHFKVPYEITLNFAVQDQFTNHDSIEVRYVGNLGRQLESGSPYNNDAREALTPASASVTACTAAQLAANPYCANSPLMPDGTFTVPFPNMGHPVGPMLNTGTISAYHSGELEYQHQFAGGFNMDANYTYASCLSDSQGGQQDEGGPTNSRAPWIHGFGGYRADYDRCSNFATNVFKLSGEYGLPFGKGALVGGNANALADAIIGGWKLDPIWIASGGFRTSVSCQGTIGGNTSTGGFTGPWYGTGTAWACDAPLVPGVNPYNPGSADQPRTKVTGYFNSAAFTAPAQAVQINGQQDFSPWGVRGNQLVGPGYYDVDLALHKQFRITESKKFEIAAVAIDAFNHVHLNNPGTGGYTKPNESVTSGFGTITGDASNNGAGRVFQFSGKIFF